MENVVVESALSRLSMGCLAHVEEDKKELTKDIHILTSLGVWLLDCNDGGVVILNRGESYLATEVEGKQDNNPILLQLNCLNPLC